MPHKIAHHDEHPTSRLIGRLLAEFQISAMADALAAYRDASGQPPQLDRSIILLVIWRAALSGGRNAAPAPFAGISVNAIAGSLGRPFETVRRHVTAMIDAGLVERRAGGVALADRMLADPAMIRLQQLLHDNLVRLIADLSAFAIPLPAPRGGGDYDPAIGTAAAIDQLLVNIEYHGGYYTSWLEMTLVVAVMVGSVRHITHDPQLARDFAGAATPVTPPLRYFVSVQPLAETLGVSGATLRRHVATAVATGKLEGSPHRLRVSDSFLRSAAVNISGAMLASRAAQMLGRLAAGGFDFTAPDRHYLVARPPVNRMMGVVPWVPRKGGDTRAGLGLARSWVKLLPDSP